MNASSSRLKQGPRFDGATVNVSHIWFDVDNTLVANNSSEAPTFEFIQTAQEAGKVAVLSLATARPLQKSGHIIRAARMEGLSILSNGAQVFDGSTGEMLIERTLGKEPTNSIVTTLQKLDIDHWVNDGGVDYIWQHGPVARRDRQSSSGLGEYAAIKNFWQPVSGSNRLLVPDYTPNKPLVIVAHDITSEQVALMNDIASEYSGQNVAALMAHETKKPNGTTSYEVFFLDQRANKKAAMLEVLEELRVARERSMAVGDGPNDAVIVETAGVGVAMGNGVAATKAVATYIAPSREDNGAQVTLEELILKK